MQEWYLGWEKVPCLEREREREVPLHVYVYSSVKAQLCVCVVCVQCSECGAGSWSLSGTLLPTVCVCNPTVYHHRGLPHQQTEPSTTCPSDTRRRDDALCRGNRRQPNSGNVV